MKSTHISKKLTAIFLILYIGFGLTHYVKSLNLKKIKIIPNNDKFVTYAYSDGMNGGASKVINFVRDTNYLQFIWEVKEGVQFPYAGVSISQPEKKLFSIEGYDHIDIQFKNSTKSSLLVYVHYFIENYTDVNDITTSFIQRFLIHIDNTEKSFHIPINRMETPDWWYENNPKIKNFIPKKDHVIGFSIEDAFLNKDESKKSFSINNMTISCDKFKRTLWFFLYLLLIPLFLYVKRVTLMVNRRLNPQTNFYLKNDTPNLFELDKEKIESFIQENFPNPDLSKKELIKKCAISDDRISYILKESHNSNFRTYLNDIRLLKAKKLIETSDLSITEISLETGYNLPSSFNRSFKKKYGKSPREMRNGKDI